MTVLTIYTLLIEDNPGDARLICELLKDASGVQFKLTHVDRLAAAYEYFAAESADVLLLDLGLPDAKGLEALIMIRELAPMLPVVVLTGLDDEEIGMQAVSLGAQDYLVKGQVDAALLSRVLRYAIEREQAEESIRAAQHLAQSTIDSLKSHICVLDESGTIMSVNKSWTDFTRSNGGDLKKTGKGINYLAKCEVTGDPDRALAQQFAQGIRTVMSGESELFEVEYPCHSPQEDRWFIGRVTPLLKSGSGARKVVVAHEDITVRKLAESDRVRLLSQVREQAQRIRQLMDTVPQGIVLLNDQGRISLVNPVAEKDLSILAGEMKGDVLTHLGGRSLADLLVIGDWQDVTAGGHIFKIIARPMQNGSNSGSWALVIDDVTELRVTQRYQQAQERLATVGQLAAGIAHDFNNVMSVITLYTQLMQSIPNLSAKHQQHLTLIRDQAHHAANLISQILDFSRRSDMERRPIDLLPLMKEFVKLLKHTLPENILLSLPYAQKSYVVLADPTRLQQAFMNMALNARDAMPHGGKLSYSFSVLVLTSQELAPLPDMGAGQWLLLAVSDTGNGIAPEYISRIFDPFFTTKEVGKGTGLGLAQVYGIVKQHGGFIDVQSQVGKGTTFDIYLPLIAESAVDSDSESTADLPETGTETILLVEDNSPMLFSVMEALTSVGYEVLPAAEGGEAQVILAREGRNVDLVLTDLVMPGIDGVQLIKAVCQTYPNMQFLVMTGHTLEDRRFQALQETAVPWIQKPFTIAQLAKKIRSILDSDQTTSPAV